MDSAASFHEAAAAQRFCAVCGAARASWDAHHVVEKQLLKRRGLPLNDPRNALRVCERDHGTQTNAMKRIPLPVLTQDNLDYTLEVLGAYAADYLVSHYEGYDERVHSLACAIDDCGVGCLNCHEAYTAESLRQGCESGDYHQWSLSA